MNSNHQSPDDIVDRAAAELRSASNGSGPSPQLLTSTIDTLLSRASLSTVATREVQSVTQTNPIRNSKMLRIIRWSGLAVAAAVLAAVTLLWMPGSRGSAAFAQVLENVKKAASVTFTLKQQAGSQPESLTRCFLHGEQMRIDLYFSQDKLPDNVIIADFKKLEGVQLDLSDKTYLRMVNLNREAMKQFGSPLNWLANLHAENVEPLADEELDDQKVKVYRLKKIEYPLGEGTLDDKSLNKVWVNAKTDLPIKIAVTYFDTENNRKSQDVYENFVWNEPITAELFALDAPAGFKEANDVVQGNVLPPFVQMLENVKKAGSVSFTTTEHFRPGLNLPDTEESRWHLQGKLLREEKFVTTIADANNNLPPTRTRIRIVDGNAKQLLEIDYRTKTIRQRHIPDAKAEALTTVIDTFSTLSIDDAEPIGEEVLNGRKTQVYRLKKLNPPLGTGKELADGTTAKLWADAVDGMPVRIQINQPDKSHAMIVLDEFTWNKPIDPALFKPELPEDFKIDKGRPQPAKERR